MMRCLRCALEYGPDERYCQRCGRTLSKPIGAPAEPAGAHEGRPDTAYLYSTFSPPAVGDVHTAEAIAAEDAAPPRQIEHAGPSDGAWQEDIPHEDEDDPWADERAALPQDEDPYLAFDGFPRDVRVPVDDDEIFDESETGEAPAVVESLEDAGPRARHYGPTQAGRHSPSYARMLILPIALLIIVLAAGAFAWSRHASYAHRLASARTLASSGQYQSAIDEYQRAIGVWPLNDDARKGQATAVAALAAQRAAAAAAAQAAQVHAQAEIARGEMLQAKQIERRAAAQQFDASAAAATTVQQVPGAAPRAPAAAQASNAAKASHRSGAGRVARLRAALRATKPLIYAAIGASETVGVGAADPATQSWVADLARRLPAGSRLVNLGKSGALLSYGVQAEMPQAIASRPDVITIWMAVNDLNALLKARPTPAVFNQQVAASYGPQLATLLATLRLRTHAALFIGNVPDLALEAAYRSQGLTEQTLAPYIAAFNQRIARIARTQGAVVVDLYGPTRSTLPAHPEYVSGDGFHPSTSGYASIAAIWWKQVHGVAQGAR